MRSPRLSIIPARAATDPSLQPRDLQVLCVLGRHTDDYGWCRRSQVRMATEMGCAHSTVRAAIGRLVDAGYLERHVQETESGRDSAHLYRVILDPVHPAIETVPDADFGADEAAAIGAGTPGDTPPPLAIHRQGVAAQDRQGVAVYGSPPINDPSLTTPSNDRERARARDEDRKIIERWLKRVHPTWPSYVSDSGPKAFAAALTLSEAERETAATRMADYVAAAKVGGRTVLCTFAVYLAEKRWEKLPPPAEIPFDEFATPFSKAWGAWIIAHLLTAPDEAAKGWPMIAILYRKAAIRQGHKFARRWHELGAELEPVPVRSAVFADWRAEFERRGWPWMPDPGDQPVVHLPAGGVAGLAAFETALLAGTA